MTVKLKINLYVSSVIIFPNFFTLGLSTFYPQAISWTDDNLVSISPQEKN